jgi:hypothetical protein
MSIQFTEHSYALLEGSTPTGTPHGTPLTTPSKAALLRPNFLTRGSPIKFNLSTPEKQTLETVEYDAFDEFEEPEKKRKAGVRQIITQTSLWLFLVLLVGSAVYL